MPFELKNVGATYQRLMNKIFYDQIGGTLEVYVDDMIVKSKSFKEYVRNMEEILAMLDQYQMKLIPTKCTFFIKGGKFLGYMASSREIKCNSEKVQAILDMPQPTCI